MASLAVYYRKSMPQNPTTIFVCSHENDPFFQEGRSRTLWAASMASSFAQLGFTTHLVASVTNTAARSNHSGQLLSWIKDETTEYYGTIGSYHIISSEDAIDQWKTRKQSKAFLLTRSPLLARIAIRHGLTALIEDHNEDIQRCDRSTYQSLLETGLLKSIACITKDVYEDVLPFVDQSDHCHVLPSGVDIHNPIQTTSSLKDTCIVYMGGLHSERGVTDLFSLAKNFPDIPFVIFGGRERDMQVLRRDWSSSCNLILSGFHRRNDILKFLKTVNPIFVYTRHHSSSSVTSPLKLLEYLNSGCLIVSADIQNIEFTKHCPGLFYYQPSSTESLKTAIVRAVDSHHSLTQADRSNLQQIRLRLIQDYSWTSRAQKILSICQQFQ